MTYKVVLSQNLSEKNRGSRKRHLNTFSTFIHFFVCVCVCVCMLCICVCTGVGAQVPWYKHGGQRDWFFLSAVWVLGTELSHQPWWSFVPTESSCEVRHFRISALKK
ncbi:mCG1034380 [Mus musculus]|nr:mCG1034380 [Mus musculus]